MKRVSLRRTSNAFLSPILIARVSLVFLMFSTQTFAQGFEPTLQISPSTPGAGDSILVTLRRPLGGCRPGPRVFSLEKNGQILTIVHVVDLNLPVPAGPCIETYDLGTLAGGTYQLVWKEVGLRPPHPESIIATLDFAVFGAALVEVPTLTRSGLAALVLTLGTFFVIVICGRRRA